MSRKGYKEEYIAKQKLIEEYGKPNVLKIAIGQSGPDYIILKPLIGIEVKSKRGKKYYPYPHDIEQFAEIKKWSAESGVPVFYWVRTVGMVGKKRISEWKSFTLEEFGREFIDPYLMKEDKNATGTIQS